MSSVISIRDLHKTYMMGSVEVQALRGVSFDIDKGELVAIMGPSGSGKSTLMNILGCLDQPSVGSYTLDGLEVSNLSDNELADVRGQRIGFVFQSFNLLKRTPAIEQVELPLVYSGEPNRRQRALEALELVGLGNRAGHKPTELSGGEQQRVAIARALVNNPALILADEPTGNLDSRRSEEIMAIFQRLNRDLGVTIVLVTHEPDVGEHTRRIITVRDGHIESDRPARYALAGVTLVPEDEGPAQAAS